MGLLHKLVVFALLALSSVISTYYAQSDLEESKATYVIAAQLNHLDGVRDDISTLEEKFNNKIKIFHATKAGFISLHVDDDQKDHILQHISSDIPSANVLNVEEVPDIEIKDGWKARRHKRDLGDFDLESYNTYPSIYEYLDELSKQYPKICETETIGTTYEGRDIRLIKIHGANNTYSAKVRIFIDGAQHAREWISPAVLVYMINTLVTGYANNAEWIVPILDKYEFNIVPILNPDGYEYTYNVSGARFWRKNRKHAGDEPCFGVDLNRNWGFHWSGMGASPYKCSDIYHGIDEFSEEETKAASDYIARYSGSWHSYFSFHSFGQMILFPWSHSSVPNPDHFKHLSASKAMAEGIKVLNNVTYAVGSVGNLLYAASGSSESWAYGRAEIPYSYTLELPDLYRFIIPKERIAPTAIDIMMGFKYYFKHIEDTRPDLYPTLLNASRNLPTPASTSSSSTLPNLQQNSSPLNSDDEIPEFNSRSFVPASTTTQLADTKADTPSVQILLRTKSSTLLPIITELSQTPVNAQSSTTESSLRTLSTQQSNTKAITDTPSNSDGAESSTLSSGAKPVDCLISKFPCSDDQQTTTPPKCQSSKCSSTAERANIDLILAGVSSNSSQLLSTLSTYLFCYLVTMIL